MLSMFGKSKKSVSTPTTISQPQQPSPPRLDRLPSTSHGHPDGGALSRVVMVCKTEQSTVTATGGAEETVTRVTVSTFRGNNRAERRVTTTEKSTPGTPRTPAIMAPPPQAVVTKKDVKATKNTAKKADFATECLNAHNEYRAVHKVPSLVLNRKLCRYAEEWAKHLADRNVMEHRNDIDLGENIFSCWIGKPNRGPVTLEIPISGREPVDSWYREASEHPYGQEPINLRSGHFSQVVWRDSRELGVGVARSKQGHCFVVANYSPPGNFIRNFAENVPPPGGFSESMAAEEQSSAAPSGNENGNDHDVLNATGLRIHNEHRRTHAAPEMATDKKVAKYAQEWAIQLARENKFMHRPDLIYGENIFTAWSSGGPPMTAAAAAEAACKSWYDEEKLHKYGKEPKDLKAGHFSQMVWTGSTQLGMGIGRGDKNRVVVVANYNPRGNIIGQFAKNVNPKNK